MPLSRYRKGELVLGANRLAAYEPGIRSLIDANLRRLYDVQADGAPVYSPREVDALRAHVPDDVLARALDGTLVVEAEADQVHGVGGFVSGSGGYGEIICAFVRPELHGSRVFTRMLVEAATQAPGEGIHTLEGFALRDSRILDVYRRLGCRDLGEARLPVNGLQIAHQHFEMDIHALRQKAAHYQDAAPREGSERPF
ncbi:MAG: hypothetical protein HY520_03065 [Candidatus Aenigmarchaeota archaeon]|nr:hypothetical protein [Candidatus Aenigmarchaeota archaeon]